MDTKALVVLVTLTLTSPTDSQHHSGSKASVATLSSSEDALHALEMKTKALEAKLGDVMSTVSTLQETIRTMESKIGATLTNEGVDGLQSTDEYNQEEMNALASNSRYGVFFRVSFRKKLTLIKVGRVKFDLVEHITGYDYNPTFTTFTALGRGLYVFTTQIVTSGAQDVNVALQVMDRWRRAALIPFKPGSSPLVYRTVLQRGDEVFVNNIGPHVISARPSSFFSGCLEKMLDWA